MPIDRRASLGWLAGAFSLVRSGRAFAAPAPAPARPDWSKLKRELGTIVQTVRSPLAAVAQSGGAEADALFAALKNPYYLGDEPGLTQTLGWIDAWTSRPSEYVVAAEHAGHVAAAVDFARDEGVRLVVKGGGHSYFGNSNAAESLLIWTRRLQSVELREEFVPMGAGPGSAGVPAVTVGAGCLWGRVYQEVAVRGGRYVQGGGCLTVGVTGFTLGGGFGSFSKAFGTGAANLLEAEVVTADGRVRIVNTYQEPDLFHALRGGGGGSFAVATRLTLRTHKLPATMGAVLFEVTAASDEAWQRLVTRILAFYAEALFNPHWGEQLRFSPGRRLGASMLFQDLSEARAREIWLPLFAWLAERAADYRLGGEPLILALPGSGIWDPDVLRGLPGIVLPDTRPGAASSDLFWASNLGETAQVLNAYQSAWLPQALLAPARRAALADALMAGSAIWPMTLHTNKGLAGGAEAALARTRETATNPQVLDAFCLLICAADAEPAWPGLEGREPQLGEGRRQAAQVAAAMRPIRSLVPDAGAYVSEADYFQKDWQRAYWGEHYGRLLETKRRYDPTDLFRGHHTVGSAG